MKRLCIYVVFDKQKVINRYIGTVLKALKENCTDIVVVCNFKKVREGLKFVIPYTNKIYYRENIGFDAGAYKDIICNEITFNGLENYDELVLSNDTYFAPVYSFSTMFKKMQSQKCDYWGITRRYKGRDEYIGEYGSHVQSYFMCFRSKVIHSQIFKKYWDSLQYAKDKYQAIREFEVGLNKCLCDSNFKWKAYMDVVEHTCQLEFNQESINPFTQYAYELIAYYKIPILKKNNFRCDNRWFVKGYRALDFIAENTKYDTSQIIEYVSEYQKNGLMGTYYDLDELEKFVMDHDNIYIYGAGVWGQIIIDYFGYRNWNYKDVVVTSGNKDGITTFSSVNLTKNDGIIIAQKHKEKGYEIIDYIRSIDKKVQLFVPNYK